MSDIVIKVDNLSKQYRLGKVGTGTLAHDLNRWWAKVRGKEDPYLKIGSENKRDEKGDSDYVWALRDINFEVKEGEVLGIIGKNGAGKSTLLKILSRVTAPSGGELKIKGRIASLLEVGTGFHPELTGKENIFLNGAILGMTKQEIKSKYDEIVEFSGVERYIDTPVKRYSSGMYVRLAFAVAAHLEPEILVVDEVLAVGDAEFQKKCLGKMKDVAGQGRTVLFVSHNMSAISGLCTRGVLLSNGSVSLEGDTEDVVNKYINDGVDNRGFVDFQNSKILFLRSGKRTFGEILNVSTLNERGQITDTFKFGKTFNAALTIKIKASVRNPEIGFCISTPRESRLHHFLSKWEKPIELLDSGIYNFSISVPQINLYPGDYTLTVWFRYYSKEGSDDFIESPLTFKIIQADAVNKQLDFTNVSASGGIYKTCQWDISKLS